jgi:hypothetical protein
MDENWILILKIIIGGGTIGASAVCLMVARLGVAYIQRDNQRKLTIKKFDIDGREIEYTFNAHTASEEAKLLEHFTSTQPNLIPVKSPRNLPDSNGSSLPKVFKS